MRRQTQRRRRRRRLKCWSGRQRGAAGPVDPAATGASARLSLHAAAEVGGVAEGVAEALAGPSLPAALLVALVALVGSAGGSRLQRKVSTRRKRSVEARARAWMSWAQHTWRPWTGTLPLLWAGRACGHSRRAGEAGRLHRDLAVFPEAAVRRRRRLASHRRQVVSALRGAPLPAEAPAASSPGPAPQQAAEAAVAAGPAAPWLFPLAKAGGRARPLQRLLRLTRCAGTAAHPHGPLLSALLEEARLLLLALVLQRRAHPAGLLLEAPRPLGTSWRGIAAWQLTWARQQALAAPAASGSVEARPLAAALMAPLLRVAIRCWHLPHLPVQQPVGSAPCRLARVRPQHAPLSRARCGPVLRHCKSDPPSFVARHRGECSRNY